MARILEDFVEDLLGRKPKEFQAYLAKSIKRAYPSLRDDEPEEEGEGEEDLGELIAKLYKKAKEEGATADMLRLDPEIEAGDADSDVETKVAARSEGYMRASFIDDLERYLDDVIAEEQISVPRWFKQYVQTLEPSSRREMLSTLKGMSADQQKEFIGTHGKKGAKGAGIATSKESEFVKKAKQAREKIGGALAMGKSEKFDPEKASVDITGVLKDKDKEEEEKEPARREPSDEEVVQFAKTIRSIDRSAAEAVDKVTRLSSELQAFLNGEATAGELRRAATEADVVADRLQRDAGFLKKYAGVKEARKTMDPEMAKMVRRWAALAQSGREAKAGEHTAISSFPTLVSSLKRALENWKGAKRDPEAAMNLWEVAGELAGQTQAIRNQVANLINANKGNTKIRLAKRGGRAPSRETLGVTKQARHLASKLVGGTQLAGAGKKPGERGMPEDYLKKQIKGKLEELVKTQGYTQREIARQFGVGEHAVVELAKYSGAELPGTAGKTPSGTPERRMERVPGELPKQKYRVAGGELVGGDEGYYKKLWAKEAEAAGVDDEVVARVLKRMKEEGSPINPDELGAELGIDRDQALKIMEKLPRKGDDTPVEDVRRKLFVPVEFNGTTSHKQFLDTIEEFDSSLIEETYNITEVLEAILELAH